VIAAGLLAQIDFEKATTAGKIWRFAGLDPTVKWEKGKKRPWNADLKTLCYKIGECFVKVQGNPNDFYGAYFRRFKDEEWAHNIAGDYVAAATAAMAAKKFGRDTDALKWYSGKISVAEAIKRAKRSEQPIAESESNGREQPMNESESILCEQPSEMSESIRQEQPCRTSESKSCEQPQSSSESSTGEQPGTASESNEAEHPHSPSETTAGEQPGTASESMSWEQPLSVSESKTREQPQDRSESIKSEQPGAKSESKRGEQPIARERCQPMLPPAHIHARARRRTVKLFLSHYFTVGFELHYGRKAPSPYVIEHMGHVDEVPPPNWP
jgi:hypothetical protein